ncbi:MAG: HAMP domain-containing histidine kinase [Actinobacteria bacterium]|nr:HAMP domain-containing histidine kinase [Actinomycetota bacterium]
MSTSDDSIDRTAAATADGRAMAVLSDSGMHLLIDSESLDQAVYLYRPVFETGSELIVDLEIVMVNEAARHVLLSTHIVEGVLASDVFVDMHEALVAANAAWQGQRAAVYHIERKGFHDGQPLLVHYEVATMRVDDHIVQVSVDHTMVGQLASADARFRLMAEADTDPLLLLSPELAGQRHVVVYANPAALAAAPELRIGARLPQEFGEAAYEAIEELRHTSPVRRRFEREVLARRITVEATFTAVGDGQVMVAARELTSADAARVELERSDRVLRAIGAGAFGTIAVYEPEFLGDHLSGLHLLWSAAGHGHGGGHRPPLDPTSVLSASDVLHMAQVMLTSGELKRSGWVPVSTADGDERSVEFTLVLAGDRFVLEFVERTEELAARTALAMITATSEAQRSFLSRVSHELRSPLNVIHGYSQLLSRLRLPEPANDHVLHIESGVHRMVQIVDDLLLLGQLDQGLLRLEAQTVDIGDLAADVVSAAAHESWWRPDLFVSVTERSVGVHVRTDRARFAMVAVLVAEASMSAAPDDAIEIASFARGTRAGLQFVTPSTASVIDAVWRPFVESHTIPGSGLGLAVARGMAKALDVAVELRDVPGDVPSTALVLLTQSVT